MKRWIIGSLIAVSCLLSGCGGSFSASEEQQRLQQQVNPDDVQAVQRAVEAFQQDSGGLLPIKTVDNDTDIYIKYLIDFQKLVPTYLAALPDNAYEKGGIYQYVIWDAEQSPTVKLVDLNAAERIREINLRVMVQQYPAFQEQIADYIYTLNYERMGLEPLSVQSPYSTNYLPIVVTTQGQAIVDYRIDLQRLIDDMDIDITPGEDLRPLLIERFDVLPAYSVPYTVNEAREVVFFYTP
ncbi:hypothetical protein [Caryophanon tenue]|nr:hypothetical protein [Caryophanon tenue]